MENDAALLLRMSSEEKAYFQSVFSGAGLSLSAGLKMSAHYVAQKLEKGEFSVTKAGFSKSKKRTPNKDL